MALPSWFVCILGMGTVFVGLLILVAVCQLLGVVFKNSNKRPSKPDSDYAPVFAPSGEIPNKQELIAAVSAAVAEELGEDVSAIRITSIRRI